MNVINTNHSDSSVHDENESSWNTMAVGETYQTSHSITGRSDDSEDKKLAKFATMASWIVNWFLLVAKIICFVISGSKAILAALADSAVDLVSQAVLSMAENYISKHNPDYPIGRSRLEALSVLACASIMIFVSIEVIQFSAVDLNDGIHGSIPEINVDKIVYILSGIGVLLKLVLYFFCAWAQKVLDSDMLEALAEDHLNDVMSNSIAIVTAALASQIIAVWWLDATGAIIISAVIIFRWGLIIREQVKKIVGFTAPPEFVQIVSIYNIGIL